jgi:asparagine synthase (glutamine-hydrolysing)
MPGLVGMTLRGARELDAASVVASMQRLITHPRYSVAEAAVDDGLVRAARSHSGRGRGPAQPARAGGRTAWMDGEIVNAGELGGAFAGVAADDPAIVLGLLDGAGGGLVAADGSFSAVISHPVAGTVQLVSDRFGLRPLYWTINEGRLLWSSNIAGFLGHPGFAPRIDRRAVAEFLECGHAVGTRTVFEGVELLRPGTVLTFRVADGLVTGERYWWWDRIGTQGRLSLNDAADELGRRVRRAVERRASPSERVGVSLSGGLDSRAIVAALPPRTEPPPAVTFGRAGCLDIAIAARVAAVKGARHHVQFLTAENWLAPRSAGVWWTDGQFNLVSMHGMEAADLYREVCDVHLDGFGGDFILGGMYMGKSADHDRFSPDLVARRMKVPLEFLGDLSPWDALGRSDYYLIENRGRRMNGAGTRFMQVLMEERKPFLDKEVVEFLFSLPDGLRARGLLYRRALLRTFPEYYRGIPWASLSVPISWPRGVRRAGRTVLRRGHDGRVRALGMRGRFWPGYTDYPAWLRVEPGRSTIETLLRDPGALYPEYVSRDRVLRLWDGHLAGADNEDEVGRMVALEIWLQQVFAGRFRPVDDDGAEAGA